jgi:hypothetical protein
MKIFKFLSLFALLCGIFACSTANLTSEAADRLAIRELLDAYAHDADRKLTSAQSALFTDDAVIEVYAGEPDNNPVQVLP